MTQPLGKKGKAVLLHCDSMEYEYIPLELEGFEFVVIDSGIKRELRSSEYNQRRRECEEAVSILSKEMKKVRNLSEINKDELKDIQHIMPENIYRRCRHVVEENERVRLGGNHLKKGDITSFGMLLVESHNSLRDLFEVSLKELDLIVELLMKNPNVLGARLTGAGFGGCIIALIKKDHIGEIGEKLTCDYKRICSADMKLYPVKAVDGARVV